MKEMERNAPQEAYELDKHILIGNMMQIELAERHDEDLSHFIETRAGTFREIISTHPEYLEEFEADPEGTLKKIEDTIYH